MKTTKRIQGIADSLKQERPYASFFEGPDKQIKEQGVVQNLLKAMESRGEAKYLAPFDLRPPVTHLTVWYLTVTVIRLPWK